jgi:hypothetical protein
MLQPFTTASIVAISAAIACGSPVRAESQDWQPSCAAQARIAFEELTREYVNVLESLAVPFEIKSNDYEAHYSRKVNRCLFLVRKTATVLGRTSQISYLLAADNRDMYALYVDTDGKKESCALIPSIAQSRACEDESEFEAFVAQYMR